MRLHDRLCQPDEHRAARLPVIELAFEFPDAGHAHRGGKLRKDVLFEHVLHHAGHEKRRSLNALEQNIAGKAVGHHNVRLTQRHAARLDIADKVYITGIASFFEQRVRIFLQLRSLRVLHADIEKRHAGIRYAQHLLCVVRAHERKLEQELRRTLRRRAAVDEHRAARFRRNYRPHRRSSHALDALDNQRRRR